MMATTEKTMRVLIVEDDGPLRKFIILLLRDKFEFIFSEAENCKLALELLEKESFDLLILDLLTPEINGMDFLRTIRSTKRFKDLPVIIITCISDRKTVVEMVSLGVEDYMVKPLNGPQLVNKIRDFIKKKRGW